MGVCDHEWQLSEVLVDEQAADLVATCIHCGTPALQAGKGRSQRPRLEEFPD